MKDRTLQIIMAAALAATAVCAVVVTVVLLSWRVQAAPAASGNGLPEPTERVSAKPTAEPVEDMAYLEDVVTKDGLKGVKVCVLLQPGESLWIDLPHQDDYRVTNTEDISVIYKIAIPESAFYPNKPLKHAAYEVDPTIQITGVDGGVRRVHLPFTIIFPSLTFELTSPAGRDSPVKAEQNNLIWIEGQVAPEGGMPDAHATRIFVNGQALRTYQDGYFLGYYHMESLTEERVVVRAELDNWVTATMEFVAVPSS